MPDDPEAGRHADRSFASFLAGLEDGALHHELSVALQDIVATLRDHRSEFGGKPQASIAIALKLTLDGGTVEVLADFKATKPRAPRTRSIYWPTGANHLSRSDPRQLALPVRDVTSGDAVHIRNV